MQMLSWLVILTLQAAALEFPPIGIIDFYGLGSKPVEQVREALGIKEGDTVSGDQDKARQRLEALPGVQEARLNVVCCEAGKAILYVGLRQKEAPAFELRPAPQGKVRLPSEIVKAGEDFDTALWEAVRSGDAGEDHSAGHAISNNSELRAIQERFKSLANRHLARLRDVLLNSADADQRARAAQVIAYAQDKEAIVPDLVRAMQDREERVRNNSMRALGVLAAPEYLSVRKLRIPVTPLIDMLNSIEWSDKNKACMVLDRLTAGRDSGALSQLRSRALDALIEMARWKAPGHGQPAFFLLGRIAGLSEDRIQAAWDAGDREAIISAARQ